MTQRSKFDGPSDLSILYRDLMQVVRQRFDAVGLLKKSSLAPFVKCEMAALHGRKIVEGIAFGCLVATENGLGSVPRAASGQWNAETIMQKLDTNGVLRLPSPSVIRASTPEELTKDPSFGVRVEGVPGLRLDRAEIVSIYRRLHRWNHELNPYTGAGHSEFAEGHGAALWEDLARLEDLVRRHVVSIGDSAFYCTLRDSEDGLTKVLPLSREASDGESDRR